MGNGILCQYRHTVGSDQFGDTVVDLRVNMIRAAAEYDSPPSGFFQVGEDFFALLFHIVAESVLFAPCGMGGTAHFFFFDPVFRAKYFDKLVGKYFFGRKRHERIQETHLSLGNGVDVVLDVFRIRGHDRAVVVVVGIRKFVPLIRNARIKDHIHTFIDQPLDMAVGELCRIALGFAGNGFDAQLVNPSCRLR